MTRKITTTFFVASVILIVSMLLIRSPAPDVLALSPPPQGLKRVADFYFDVATGDIRGHSPVNKFGGNPDVDSAAVEDIWDGGGTWNEPSVSQVYTFTSTSAADASDGAGARTMEIFGLDAVGILQNETILLSGTVVVTAANPYSMIHRMIVRTAGITAENVGIITANANTDGTVTAQINATNNQTLMAVYKIPADSDGCLINFYASLLKATGATATVNIIVKAKPVGEVYQIKHKLGIIKDGTSEVEHQFFVPNCFEPLTIIKMAADSNVDNVDTSGGFGMVLHPN